MRTILSSIAYPILGLVFALSTSSCVTPGGSSVSSGPVALHSPTLAAKWQVNSDADSIRYVDPSHSLNFLTIRKLDGPGPKLAEPPLVTPLGDGAPRKFIAHKTLQTSMEIHHDRGPKCSLVSRR